MYKIEKRPSGFLLTFAGMIGVNEIEEWMRESERALSTVFGSFGVIVDMRTLIPLSPNAQVIMVKGQKLYKDKGMKRSAVILADAVTTLQFKRLAKQSGIYDWERYIDADRTPDWQKVAVDWVKNGIDPDVNSNPWSTTIILCHWRQLKFASSPGKIFSHCFIRF